MKNPLDQELQKLGFSDKESKVYLASLKLGPAPIQNIAKTAEVKRATTYVMVETLKARGLMSSFIKGKKTLFVAESPERISAMLQESKREIESKQKAYEELLPNLRSLLKFADERPAVTFYEGVEGLRVIHQDVLSHAEDSLENVVSLDDARRVVPDHDDVAVFRERLEKRGTRIRILYCATEAKMNLPDHLSKKWHVKRISADKFPLHGELTIYGDKVAIFSYKGKIVGSIIESKEIAQTVRVLFNLAWNSGDIKTEA